MVKMVWLRLETEFMLVERTVRRSLPEMSRRVQASTSSTTKEARLDSSDLMPPFEIESLSDLDGWRSRLVTIGIGR